MFPWDCSTCNKDSELTMLPSFHFMLKSVRKHPSFNWDLPGILKEWLLRSQYLQNNLTRKISSKNTVEIIWKSIFIS